MFQKIIETLQANPKITLTVIGFAVAAAGYAAQKTEGDQDDKMVAWAKKVIAKLTGKNKNQ